MPNLEIADQSIRDIVSELVTTGIPKPFTKIEELTEEQHKAYLSLSEAVERFGTTIDEEVNQKGLLPQPGSQWWNGCLEFGVALRNAIKNGLIRGPMIQEHMIDFGAIPDPETDWKWVMQPNGSYICWECGSEILEKTVRNSIHFAGMRGGAGGGEVRGKTVPYCPTCDPEPRDGVVYE